jgi:hypothetical protein
MHTEDAGTTNEDLRNQVARLERELAELRVALESQANAATPEAVSDLGVDDGARSDASVSRRNLLRLAGVTAAAGAAGAVLAASPAGAAANDPILMQPGNTADANATTVTSTSSASTFHAINTGTGNALEAQTEGAAVAALVANANGTGSGIKASTADATVAAIVGDGPSGGFGVAGISSGVSGVGVTGTGPIGVYGITTATTGFTAVRATPATTNSVGFEVQGPGTNTLGVKARGTRAPLQLVPAATAGAPATGTHEAGELYVDSGGDLYLCTVAGTPGTWTRLNGQSVASGVGFNFLPAPIRVYDSRVGQPPINPTNPIGPLAFGVARDIDCSIPAGVASGAVGLLFNVTVANTTGSFGALTIYKFGVAAPSTSSINWVSPGSVVANSATSGCDINKKVTVKCVASAGCASDFILDVIGYYK